MPQINTALTTPPGEPPAAVVGDPDLEQAVAGDPNLDEIEKLLLAAASLASANGLAPEVFMNAAWTACLAARPGLREQLADKELKSQIRKLRKRGLVGQA